MEQRSRTVVAWYKNLAFRGAMLRLWADRKGQDLIEYALMTCFVTLVAYGFLPTGYAPALSNIWSKVSSVMCTLTGVG